MYLYVSPDLRRAGAFDDPTLAATTERHHVRIEPPPMHDADASVELNHHDIVGVLLELASGLPTAGQLDLIAAAERGGRRAWIYWPHEEAVECVDQEALRSLRRHLSRVRWLKRVGVPIDAAIVRWHRVPTALRWIYRGEFPVRRSDILVRLMQLTLRAQPLPLGDLSGPGVYLRCDYWQRVSDTRMADVIASLSSAASPIVCLTASPNADVDVPGVRAAVMDRPRRDADEDALVLAPEHYETVVRGACQALRPSFVYERLTLGQSAGATVAQALAIPFIAEVPGADVLEREVLGDAAPLYPELYHQVEELALRQATVVVVGTPALRDALIARGVDAARLLVAPCGRDVGAGIAAAIDRGRLERSRAASIDTGDAYKDRTQSQWNQNPVGSQHARESQPHTLEWFREVERHRYGVYAPWMPEVMEFASHAGEEVLEVGGGIGTDLAQFAAHGARVTDVDLAAGHLRLAEENFRLRGLDGRFVHHDAEALPFPDASFDLVYSNGVLHHTPNTRAVVQEIFRVLRPGGRVIVMLYAEESIYYWRKQVWMFGVKQRLLERMSMGEILSRTVERSANDAKPLVKVYTPARAAALFERFADVRIVQRQLEPFELPTWLRRWLPAIERRAGWNLIVKATKR